MPRNLDGRVEVLCRARAEGVRKRLEEILDLYLRDDVKARGCSRTARTGWPTEASACARRSC